MANFLEPNINNYADIISEGIWKNALTADTLVVLIDHEGIAKFAVAAFQNKDRFRGRAIGLVSELLTPQDTMARLGSVMGRPLQASFMTDDEIAAMDQMMVLVKCEKSMRYTPEYIDMEELASVVPLTTFEEFLEREKANVKKL
ncbi:hypothetical protein F4779DRAFT_330642 [Xylariaceae sp. FL0662B]|nr:hypothetical protein F4779DRAFT_330642 [Xylariaceae sp. FL0662B]